ncbi:MAG: HIRAN domain-containing protein [Isosphaeraceae bacterium]|nr:HIRAN domain-containing protein [Isosphaeraceae bacterium]
MTDALARELFISLETLPFSDFDFGEYLEARRIPRDQGEKIAEAVYRATCMKAYADGVATDAEKHHMARLARGLEIKRTRRAVLEKEAKETTYRAALDAARADGVVTHAEANGLASLRKSLGIRSAKLEDLSRATERRPRIIRTKVRAVTAQNEDGRSRQDIIRRHCHDGQSLEVMREPDHEYDENAIGLWVVIPRLLFKSKGRIGYIASDLTEDLAPFVDGGNRLEAKVLNVIGGDEGRSFAVNVQIEAIGAH